MTLKRVIDADRTSADQFFLRKYASYFHRYQCPRNWAQACRLPYILPAFFISSANRF